MRRAQDIRPRDVRTQEVRRAGEVDDRREDAQRQRRAAATQEASAARRRELFQERRLRAALGEGAGDREIVRGMRTEVGVHRDRMARLQRLRRIMEARGDDDGLRRLERIETAERRRYDGLMSTARRRVSAAELRRFDEEIDRSPARARVRAAEEGGGR